MNKAIAEVHCAVLRDGRRLAWANYGDPAGRPVLYLHGIPGSRLELAGADAAARTAGLRLIAVDRPGCGRSDPRPDLTFGNYAADVTQLLDALSVSAVDVVAASGGRRVRTRPGRKLTSSGASPDPDLRHGPIGTKGGPAGPTATDLVRLRAGPAGAVAAAAVAETPGAQHVRCRPGTAGQVGTLTATSRPGGHARPPPAAAHQPGRGRNAASGPRRRRC